MGHLSTIPTGKAVQTEWERYCRLRKAVEHSPVLSHDPDIRDAVERAHQRWADAFVKWNGQ